MSTQMATFTARMPKKNGGATLEHSIQIACLAEEDFTSQTISGPQTAPAAGHVRFTVTIEKVQGGVTETFSWALTAAGTQEDFDDPEVCGPVIVVQDPPAFKTTDDPGFEIQKAA